MAIFIPRNQYLGPFGTIFCQFLAPNQGGGRLVRILHIAGWWVGHAFKSEMVSDTIWVGVLTILNDQNGIFYLKMPFFTKNLPIFTKKLQFFC